MVTERVYDMSIFQIDPRSRYCISAPLYKPTTYNESVPILSCLDPILIFERAILLLGSTLHASILNSSFAIQASAQRPHRSFNALLRSSRQWSRRHLTTSPLPSTSSTSNSSLTLTTATRPHLNHHSSPSHTTLTSTATAPYFPSPCSYPGNERYSLAAASTSPLNPGRNASTPCAFSIAKNVPYRVTRLTTKRAWGSGPGVGSVDVEETEAVSYTHLTLPTKRIV